MIRHAAWISCLVSALVGCGGGEKKPPAKPEVKEPEVKAPPPETEEDREQKRRSAAHAIVPEGSNCLPAAFKTNAPQLQIAAAGSAPILCAVDRDQQRLLGVIACWTVSIADGTLTYAEPKPLPGRGVPVKLDNNCARGFCLPKDAKNVGETALMAWNDSGKVAVLAGDDIHLFDAAGKAHEKTFSIRGDKGVSNTPVGLVWSGGTFFVEGADDGPFAAVWVFKEDGSAVGAIEALGAREPKALSTYGGSFLVLDKERVAVSEEGLTTLTTYDVATGKRAKITRKVPKLACKPAERQAYWLEDREAVPAKCKEDLEKTFGPFIGADALAGKNNHLFALRGSRIGELAVIEPKALTEKKDKLIKLPWCEETPADKEAKAGE